MDEYTGAFLAGAQREEIRYGNLETHPPRCRVKDCYAYSDVWVTIRHPDDEKGVYEIPRCSDHKDDVPHMKLSERDV